MSFIASLFNPAAPQTRRVQRVRHDLRRREVQVLRVEPVGTGFASVTFTGDDLADFVSMSFDDHIKFMFPGSDGEIVRRDYTPRAFNLDRRELTIEFALHGHGLASDWARQAAPGQQVTIGGPRGSMIVPMDYDWHLLAGDATALPAIHRRLDELPAGARAIALVLADPDADQRRFNSAAQVQVLWVDNTQAWLAALQQLQLPAGEGFAWCAGEARLMNSARAILAQQHGLPREAMRVSAYWKQGASDFHESIEG
jgi:NADPH-dependent ferric siderophore reductase